jgi:hypothetical protein
MQENTENKISNSLVPLGSKELVRLEKSIDLTEKILKEQNDRLYILNWDIIFDHSDFFNRFFSTFYSFSEGEIIEFYKKLELGYEFTSPSIDLEPLGVGQARYGLQYNKNISWTTSLKELFSKKNNNYFDFYYIKDFDELPFDIRKQVASHYHFEKAQFRYHQHSAEPKESLEIKNRYDKIIFKKQFTNNEIMTIINKYDLDYFCNELFVINLMNKLIKDIHDFNIAKFYNKIRTIHSF